MDRHPEFARRGALAFVMLVGLIAAEVVLLATIAGHGPNAVAAPLVEQSGLLATLWQSNPVAALPLIAQQPLFVIARNDPEVSLQTWGLYYFPFTFLVHVAIALVAARWWHSRGRRHPGFLVSGSAVLAFAVSYTRLASCCTGGPRWAFEVGLLALAFDPTSTRVDWSAVIVRLESFFPYLQFATGLIGIALLIMVTRRWHPSEPDQSATKPEE